jgi:hypothetical protein
MNSANIVNNTQLAKLFVHFCAVYNENEQGDMSERVVVTDKSVAQYDCFVSVFFVAL